MQLTNVMIIKNKKLIYIAMPMCLGIRPLEKGIKDKRWDYAGGMVFLCTTTTMDIT
jgi:hypothetical protein